MVNIQVGTTEGFGIRVLDAQGNPALLDGAPVWSLTDPSLGSVAVAADGMSAVVTPSGSLGSCKLQVNGDADLGAGVKTILGEADLTFVSGEAVKIEIFPVDAPKA